MPIEQTKVIDFISEKGSDKIVLSILDNLEWGNDRHLILIEKKLNAYLRFIETGELYKNFESAEGKKIGIHIFCQFEPSQTGVDSLNIAKKTIDDAGYSLTWEVVRRKRSSTN